MAKTFRYKHFYTNVSGRTPEAQDLNVAEIAVNIAAGAEKMFLKNTDDEIVEFIPEHQIDAKIEALDKAASEENGKVVVTVTQENGLVDEEKVLIKDVQLVGYDNDGTPTGSITTADTVEVALNKLENKIGSNSITNADGSIVVTAPTGSATTTDIKVKIESGEKVIALDENGGGLYTDIKVTALTAEEIAELPDAANVKEAYKLLATDGTKLGDVIKVYKDSALVEVYIGHEDDELTSPTDPTVIPGSGDTALCFIYQKVDGTYELAAVNVQDFLEESEFKDGLVVANHVVKVKIDENSEPFLTVSPDGVKLDGVQDAIDNSIQSAITALDYFDDAVDGKYVSEVDEENGVISVRRANVSDAPLNGYSKGSDYSPVESTDTLNEAISKLENQIDVASTEVHKDVDATHLTLSAETNEFGATVYTIGENDIASATALSAETARAKAVEEALADSIDELSAATEDAIEEERKRATSAETVLDQQIDAEVERANAAEADIRDDVAALSAATEDEIERAISADTFLQEEIEELSGSVQNIVEGLDYTDSAETNQWVTKVDENNGKISVERDYISITQLSTNGDLDCEEGENGDIILSAGSF